MHAGDRRIQLFLHAGIVLACGACQSARPIEAWQQRLTDYTMNEGHGDINVLRESAELRSPDSPRPAQIRFDQTDLSKSGLPPFGDRVDVNGVMVGQGPDTENPVYYFLVGVVSRPASGGASKLEDIRLVACSLREGKHTWKTSGSQPEALRRYVGPDAGRANHSPGRVSQIFPRDNDDFRLDVQGGVARATETRSGASWQLPLH
jgi:hypothetical protein